MKMENKEFSKQLEKRTKDFSISIIKLSVELPNTSEGKVVKNQITKSGTSIGANYREANRSRSKADFKNKIKICESEASETVYWLEIIDSLKWLETNKIESIIKNSDDFDKWHGSFTDEKYRIREMRLKKLLDKDK
jgi:four helix bundle protein